ncbi:C4-dicarboxylate TRAP transporter large permease protein DctM [Neomoorella glycerini]|uniref:C4-dicarboxylate TRAP transporter large permease protein DctM n=1 Tax=Neomoorella glycerini TaxID=55779 RepID=A0A6I5ZPQ8_9FIRM|nr:TRAP transporter large permease [Moorella glycerini]QGP91511.1 C4-dicarboxylate TRAP transporter large permease protein DctM [Moorella glycerini]
MTPLEVGIIGIIALLLLIFSGISVGVAMAVVGFLGFAYISGWEPAMGVLKTVPYTTAASFVMSVIPLFVLMGQLAFHSGISNDLFKTANKWLGHLPGGMAMASIAASAGFAAVCGSSPATTATVGAISLPEMTKLKYNRGFAAAAVAAGGTLGILIPPSNGFILYGVIAEQSIGKLFLAGIIPGVILAALYMVTIYLVAVRNPALAPQGPVTPWGEKLVSLKNSWAMIVLFGGIMGGILSGVFTANEAAAIGAFGALLFFLLRRKLNKENVVACLTETMNTSAMIFLVLIGANIFGYFLTVTTLPQALASFLASLPVSRYVIFIGIMTIYLFLGCIMDSLAMVVITTPIFFPVVMNLGFDPIWYGVMMVVAMEMGQITPPVGINLFVITGVAKDVPMHVIFRYIAPFVVTLIVFMFIMIAFPQTALYLPHLVR